MKKTALLFALSFIAIGCAADGKNPNVGLGVQIGGSPPPPVVASPAPQRGGPPPWAPAHGRRAKAVVYRYYPSTGVYFNVSTGSYFYMNGGSWQVSMSLPSTVKLNANDYVSVELDTDKPYLYYEEHRVKYKGKGHSHGKGKGHKKGHWKKGGPPF